MATREKKKWDLQTPSQFLENHPKVKALYNCCALGYLRKHQVIDGKKLPRGCLISEASLLNFLEWRFGMTDV